MGKFNKAHPYAFFSQALNFMKSLLENALAKLLRGFATTDKSRKKKREKLKHVYVSFVSVIFHAINVRESLTARESFIKGTMAKKRHQGITSCNNVQKK